MRTGLSLRAGAGPRGTPADTDPARAAILREVLRVRWWLRTTLASFVFGLTALVGAGYAYSRGLDALGGIPSDGWFAIAVVLLVLCVTAIVALRRSIDRIRDLDPRRTASTPAAGGPPPG